MLPKQEAVEVLGELEELKDRLAAAEGAQRSAAQRAQQAASRCAELEAQGEELRSTVEGLSTRLQVRMSLLLYDNGHCALVACGLHNCRLCSR